MTTDLQQPLHRKITSGPLGNFVEFKNGRSSPDRSNSGTSAVYGSNGIIGRADVTNAPEGTLVVGRVGSYCGSVHYSPNKCWVTDNAIIGSSRSQKDSRFWFYKLASLDLNNYRAGSGQPLLNQQILNSIQVSIPASEDDRFQIARVLAAFDDKIDVNHRINHTLESIAQAIFKSWFVDFDPVKAKIAAKQEGRDPLRAAMCAISGKIEADLDALPCEQYKQLAATAALFPEEMEESKGIPRGWELTPLSHMIQLIGGGTPKRSEPGFWGKDIPWFSVKDAPNNGDVWVINTEEKITHLGLAKSSAKLLPIGTTIISARGTVGKLALVGKEMAMNQSCYGVLGASGIGSYFNYFNLNEAVEKLKQNTHGAVFDTITQTTFDTVFCVRPCAGTLQAFENQVQPLLATIRLNANQLQALAELRDTLLPKLLSGELPVTALIKTVENA